MKYISLFSGIEAASVAWQGLPLEPVAFSEIDDFPSAVLKERFPMIPNLGDITKIEWSKYAGAVDVIVGGSPCQSFSIAGNRTGLKGQSGLMFEYIRAVREVMPRYFVWENVPGALSSEDGAAFGQLVTEMDGCGYQCAWRVLDAQFFGVPQRRRRVFLVGYLGDRSPAEILFERDSMRWDYSTGRKARERFTERLKNGITGKRIVCMGDANAKASIDNDLCGTLKVGGEPPLVSVPKTMIIRCGKPGGGKGPLIQNNLSATLSTSNIQTLFAPSKDGYIVRKLTPTECERLQGFPDGWTDIEFKGKPAPDGRRYKALGNSMAVPVMRWIGERLVAFDEVSQ